MARIPSRGRLRPPRHRHRGRWMEAAAWLSLVVCLFAFLLVAGLALIGGK